jgi:pimeloyl-[acyl-carrier protein] methyl ester esterase
MSEKLQIKILGQGPDLVLVHGWAMNSGIWGGVVDALVAEFRLHLVDLPGHGVNRHIPLSLDLNAVAAQILSELPPACWLGWSLGGLITLAAALQQPLKIKRMLLVAATPSFSEQPDWDCGVGIGAQQALIDGLEENFDETLHQFYLQTFGPIWMQEALGRLEKGGLADKIPDKKTLSTGLHLLYHNSVMTELDSIKIPALWLGGSRDRTIRPESFSRAASLMPAATSSMVTGAGHAPFISHEEKFLDIIRSFLHEGRKA